MHSIVSYCNRLSEERQEAIARETAMLTHMLEQNTKLTQSIITLTARVEKLTREVHSRVVSPGT